MRSFLYVFPTFTTVHQVLSMLIDRFTRVTEYPDCFDLRVKYAIIQVFKFWINLDLGKDFLGTYPFSSLAVSAVGGS